MLEINLNLRPSYEDIIEAIKMRLNIYEYNNYNMIIYLKGKLTY